MTRAIVGSGPPQGIRAHLDWMRMRRTLPHGRRDQIRLLASTAKKGSDEIRRVMKMLVDSDAAQAAKVLYAVCASKRCRENIFWTLLSPNYDLRYLNGVKIVSDLYQIDTAMGTDYAFQGLYPLVGRKIDYLYAVYRENRAFASAFMIHIARDGAQTIWRNLINYCFGTCMERYPTDDERRKMAIDIFGDTYAQEPTLISAALCRLARTGLEPLIAAFEKLPPSLAAKLGLYFYQHEREGFAKICGKVVTFPTHDFVQELFALDRGAAVFAARSVFKSHDVVEGALISLRETLEDVEDAASRLSQDDKKRTIGAAAAWIGTPASTFLIEHSAEHARAIERICKDNLELLRAFLADLDPKDINTILLIYGLFIWDTFDIVRELGWEVDTSRWKMINAFRLLRTDTKFRHFLAAPLFEYREGIIANFAARPQRSESEKDLFTDVMAIVAREEGDECVADLFNSVAQKNPQLEQTLQKSAERIDWKKEERFSTPTCR